MKPYSLTRRLILIILLVELTSAICVSGIALVYERHMHFRSFNILLRGRADSLLGAVQDSEDAADDVMLDGSQLSLPSDDVYEVIDDSGRVVGESKNWSGYQLSAAQVHWSTRRSRSADSAHEAFASAEINGQPYQLIRIQGLRVVDPGDKNGGVHRLITVYYGSGTQRIWGAILGAVLFYAITSLILLAITGVLLSWLLKRSLEPLRDLASTAEKVSVTSWAFVPPENARKTKELLPLITAIELSLKGLEDSFQKQRRFIGDAAHELKTGVAVVKSSLQLLTMKPRSQTEYKIGLERSLNDCSRMEDLVAQMLTLARIDEEPDLGTNPATKLQRTTATPITEPVVALREAVERLETMAQIKGITIELADIPRNKPKPANVQVPPKQFQLLCSNLLINALQHSPRGSVIRVSLTTSGSFAEVQICDQGEGIDPADLPFLFERFFRGDPSRSRHTGGAGLGLSVCKAITDRAGGTLHILSEPGVGTVAVVNLPLDSLQDSPSRPK